MGTRGCVGSVLAGSGRWNDRVGRCGSVCRGRVCGMKLAGLTCPSIPISELDLWHDLMLNGNMYLPRHASSVEKGLRESSLLYPLCRQGE